MPMNYHSCMFSDFIFCLHGFVITGGNGNVSIIRGFDNPISSIRVSRVSRVRVTLTVTVRVSRVSDMVSVRDSVK